MPAAAAASPSTRAPRRDPSKSRARKDPTPRHMDGTAPWMRLTGMDPEKIYVAVAKSGTAIEEYEMRGYEVERFNPNGLRFAAGRTARASITGRGAAAGDALESFGHVIMSISKEQAAEIEQHGDGFSMGQDFGDMVEQRMRFNKGGMVDPFRGMPNTVQNYVHVGNQKSGERALNQLMPQQAVEQVSPAAAEAAMFGEDDPLGDEAEGDA